MIDAYCGTGTIGLVAARGIGGAGHAARVIGVDETAAAIRDARANAKHNGIDNAEFVADDAGACMLSRIHIFTRKRSIIGVSDSVSNNAVL